MKFETEFGLGEICIYNESVNMLCRRIPDMMVKVVAITINLGGTIEYMVENICTTNLVQRFPVSGKELSSDPEYDQETGGYPDET